MGQVHGCCFNMKYKDELIRSMNYLAKNDKTIFIGQSVSYSGNAIYNTLSEIPDDKKIETPVFEDVQMGLSLGLALNGYIPVTCYPRFDFLILALNQMINHLDKIKFMSENKMLPRVIIRTSVGPKKPLDGGPQHTADYTEAIKKMVTEIDIVTLDEPGEIFPAFKDALESSNVKSTLLIEKGSHYNDK
jgi:pyruvate/2-oxoglutarate/acetoin dehydrogenase E1 component